MTQRVYIVRTSAGNERIVQASSQAQALRHVARSTFQVSAATPLELVFLMERGIRAEVATNDGKESEE